MPRPRRPQPGVCQHLWPAGRKHGISVRLSPGHARVMADRQSHHTPTCRNSAAGSYSSSSWKRLVDLAAGRACTAGSLLLSRALISAIKASSGSSSSSPSAAAAAAAPPGSPARPVAASHRSAHAICTEQYVQHNKARQKLCLKSMRSCSAQCIRTKASLSAFESKSSPLLSRKAFNSSSFQVLKSVRLVSPCKV